MSSPPANQRRHPKKSAFSCEACRKRKVKCDAGHPTCNRCKNRKDVCIYKLPPTLSYTQRLEHRVQQLEAELAEFKNPSSLPPLSEDVDDYKVDEEHQPSAFTAADDANVDQKLSFQEPTSLFQIPRIARARPNKDDHDDEDIAKRKASLINNAWLERAIEKLADTPEPFRSLIDSHFCWIQPLFNFVYRPAFTRDMKTGGPYFSHALLNAILSHSVRWCRSEPGMSHYLAPFNDGADFAKNARDHLFEDIKNGNSRIPTVQTLLLLSAQECGMGHRTQAWLYSGMAFRLIDDMGICIDGQKYADAEGHTPEDMEIRNRLFWSCYFWDKLISLYFGRDPTLQNSEISPPRLIMDDTAEVETWTPHNLMTSNYAPKQAHSISCFIQMCALAEILNGILINLYSPTRDRSLAHARKCALAEGSRLRDWWRDLPEHLKINLAAPNLDCPPSHIVTLNCLYHSINILLNRAKLKLSREPELASAMFEHNPLIQCISSATSIVALFELYDRAFGRGHVVLSLAYSVYTAASIFLLEIQATGNTAANTLERLSLCVRALRQLRETSPVIATASELIDKELGVLGVHLPRETPLTSNEEVSGPLSALQVHHSAIETHSMPPLASFPTGTPTAQPGDNVFLDMSYLNAQADGSMGYFDVTPEMYEAFSQIDPISVTMNAGFDIG